MLLLQPLRWCCVDCVIHHERDVREEQKYMCVARASNSKRDCDAWSLSLLAAAVRSFAHMPLGISDRNITSKCSAAQHTLVVCWCHVAGGGRISFQKCSGGPIAIKTTWFYCPKDNELKTCCYFAFEVTVYYGPRAAPGQKISCSLA